MVTTSRSTCGCGPVHALLNSQPVPSDVTLSMTMKPYGASHIRPRASAPPPKALVPDGQVTMAWRAGKVFAGGDLSRDCAGDVAAGAQPAVAR